MKYFLFLSTVLSFLFFGCRQKSVQPLQVGIDSIVHKWVPDKRIAICDLKLIEKSGSDLLLKGESMVPEAKSEVMHYLRNKGVAITDSVLTLPDSIHLGKSWGLITLSIANIRSKPSHSSEMITQAIMGTPVRLLKDGTGWILIQTPDRYIGWTNKSAVQQMSQAEINTWRHAGRKIFVGTEGNIFCDQQRTMVLSDLTAGAIVVNISETRSYTQVALPDGRTGFVARENWIDFSPWKDTVRLTGEGMIACGKRMMGYPYLWGGASSKGMDCSGFVKTVCFLNGVILERDASQQINHGVKVDVATGWDKLQMGDLLFFGSKQPMRVTHVGMYIGEGEILHESGSVHINSFDKNKGNYSEDLSSSLVGARRIIGMAQELGYMPVKGHPWY